MKKMVLGFPSKAEMAEFLIDCKITDVDTNFELITLTGYFSDECVDVARKEYGAFFPNSPDFILP